MFAFIGNGVAKYSISSTQIIVLIPLLTGLLLLSDVRNRSDLGPY